MDWESVRKEIKDIIDLCDKANDKSMQAICQKENLDCFNVQDIMSIIKKPIDKSSEDIFKVFVYDINPLSLDEEYERLKNEKEKVEAELEKLRKDLISNSMPSPEYRECQEKLYKIPDLKDFDNYKNGYDRYKQKEEEVKNIRESHQEFMKQDYLKLRLDTQKFLCFNKNGKPILERNQANMLFLALDIARVAYRHLVDEIIVFSKNEDIIPAFECAQMNDLHVSLIRIKEWDSIEDLKEKWQISEKLRRHADSVRKISLLEIIKDKKSKEGQ